MIDLFKRLIGNGAAKNGTPTARSGEQEGLMAVCALFLEMGRIDETFTQQELTQIISLLTEKYGLSRDHADALIKEADRELKESVDLWQFARVINEQFSVAEKEKLIERLWRIVFIDGKMNRYEHYLMGKLSKLLRLSHQQLIDAKLKVLHG
jgi:uncharacterized tellurite resistance protein B-like protein